MSNRTRYFITFTGTPTDQYHGANLNADGTYVIEHIMTTIDGAHVDGPRVAAALRDEYPGVWRDMTVIGVVEAYTGRTIGVRQHAPAAGGPALRLPKSVLPADVDTAVEGLTALASTPFDDRDDAAPLRDNVDILDALSAVTNDEEELHTSEETGRVTEYGYGVVHALTVALNLIDDHGPRRATVLIAVLQEYARDDARGNDGHTAGLTVSVGEVYGYTRALQVLDGHDVANDPAYVK